MTTASNPHIDSALNTVATAAITHRQALAHLADRCRDAAGLGAALSDIAEAADMDCADVYGLINQGEM